MLHISPASGSARPPGAGGARGARAAGCRGGAVRCRCAVGRGKGGKLFNRVTIVLILHARCPALASAASGVSSWPHAAILTGAVVAPERLPTASTALITCAVAALTSFGSGCSG